MTSMTVHLWHFAVVFCGLSIILGPPALTRPDTLFLLLALCSTFLDCIWALSVRAYRALKAWRAA